MIIVDMHDKCSSMLYMISVSAALILFLLSAPLVSVNYLVEQESRLIISSSLIGVALATTTIINLICFLYTLTICYSLDLKSGGYYGEIWCTWM